MSDLAQALVKKYEEKKGWSMQTWPAKVDLPVGLFASLPSHEVAQDIAEKNYLPEEMDDLLDRLVRDADKKKVRFPFMISFAFDLTNCPTEAQVRRQRRWLPPLEEDQV